MPALRLLILVCGLLLAGFASLAQTYFNERYPSSLAGQASFATSIVPIPTGYAVIGASYNGTSYTMTFRLLDPQGNLVQEREYSRPGFSYGPAFANGLLALSDGGYVAAVGCQPPAGSAALLQAMLWRFNAQGDTLWTRTYSPATECYANGICRTRDGGFALVGNSKPPGGQRSLLLIRTDSAGTLLWHQLYRQRPYNLGFNVSPTPDGGFILGGQTYEAGGNTTDAYVVKTDSLGSLQWQRAYGGSFPSGAAIVQPIHDGGYAMAASMGRPPLAVFDSQYQHFVYKLDAQGQIRWQRPIGPRSSATSVLILHELADGSLIAAGQDGDTTNVRPIGNAIGQGVVFKLCANGDSLWYRNYKILTGGNSHNYLRDLRPTPEGGFVGAGFLWARPPDTGTNDAWVFRLDSAGYLQAGGAPVTVQCRPVGFGKEVERSEEAISVYPNPSADGRFTVSLGAVESADLTVYDALGRQVLHQTTRASETRLDLSRQPAGVYALRLRLSNGRFITRQLVR